ncbi:MAG: DUF3021 domain-containing protein [Anaerovoracaceae bacterium]|jgi:hypothetical protein
MRHNSLLLSTFRGIGIAAIIFCVLGIVFDLVNGGTMRLTDYSLTKMSVGSLIIGVGFGLPSAIYTREELSLAAQTLIHMGIGCVVLTAVAFAAGWIPTDQGPLAAILAVAMEIGVAFIIWAFFYRHEKKLAEAMNRRIAEMRRD